jgi:hypothetical protein
MFVRLLLRSFLLALLVAGAASAQSIDFTLFVTLNGSSGTVGNDSTLPFNTTIGTQVSGTVQAIYNGNTQATILNTPQQGYVGSNEFTVTSNLTAGTVLNTGDSFTFTVTFNPTSSTQAGGTVSILYTEPGQGGTPVKSAIELIFDGTTPVFTLSYILQSQNNQVQIPSGGTIPFGPTQINTTASANLDISNTGTGQGIITGITQTAGSPVFKVQLIPLFPFQLGSTPLPLLVTYSPTAVENDTGQIQITYQGGATATVNLTGNGITSAFTYQYLVPGMAATSVAPGGTITFPGANVATPGSTGNTGTTSSLIVKVTNTGTASGTINSVSTSPPFTLSNPITLPVTLTTGNSFSVPLTFTPTQVGPQTGQLLIGNDFFNLSGQGLGPNLTYKYTSNGVTTTVNPTTGGSVVFSPVQVGQSEPVTFTITNSGSLPTTISLIAPSVANSPYTVSSISLPVTLKAGQSLSFTITFTPTLPGIANGTLVVATSASTAQIPLTGSATTPPALPSYTISGPSGTVQAATQSNVSLTLSKAYPLDLNGTLTLTTQGNFGTDNAVQFETGGRTVDFTIPANTTTADFAGLGSEIELQTGTLAESVTLVPTFTTAAGENVTPASPATLQFTIPSEAPVLQTAAATALTTDSFTLVLTGYTTTRSLSSLNVTFTAATGFTLGTNSLTIDISQPAATYFSSSAPSGLGGLFQVAMPFTLQGTAPTGQTLIERVASVAATVSNGTGTSNSLSAPVQ